MNDNLSQPEPLRTARSAKRLALRSAGLSALVATTAMLFTGVASANTSAKVPGASVPSTNATNAAHAAVTPSTFSPPGYTLVEGPQINVPGNTQTHGAVTCPGHKQVYGGGAFVGSAGFPMFLNSSYPQSDQSWAVDVNNQSSVQGGFNMYAICLSANTTYSVVSDEGIVGSGAQAFASVACPSHRIVVGGGVLSFSGSTLTNINSSYPVGNGWGAYMNNTYPSSTSFKVFAICRHSISGYSILNSGPVANPNNGTQTIASVGYCPGSAAKAISGGALSGSFSTSVNLNSSFPNAGAGWTTFEQNFSSAASSVTTYAICAGT
jgi:hypothetical protein